ncbi:MAG: FAD-dependent oxidoreductase [Saprospiraceae bacterium]|nr:FAD-dependent oxidoreductase [Saprospiraceae bacterium]
MKKSDSELGMHQLIRRRDFVQKTMLTAGSFLLPFSCSTSADNVVEAPDAANYPPVRTGMRGSHPGSFEVAHALARDGIRFDPEIDLDESYDLVVVGGGISGLAAAYQYRKRFGNQSRILILDNHDDFGGHAKRNEYHQGGSMRLSWGGTMNLEYLSFDDTVLDFLRELGIYPDKLNQQLDFNYAGDRPAIWFDTDTFGHNVLVPGFSMYSRNLDNLDAIDRFPISESARKTLRAFYSTDRDILLGLDEAAIDRVLHKTSYTEFLSRHAGLTADAVELFVKATDGYFGVQTHSLSTAEAMHAWLPGSHLLGPVADRVAGYAASEKVAMFPDGNASIARLLVQSLIPEVAPDANVDNVATATFDYSRLDEADAAVRVRLEATAVKVVNIEDQVDVTYVKKAKVSRVHARHCVLACYHTMIPHLCPELPEVQRDAQRYQVKHPMLLTNVLVRNSEAFDSLNISGVYCPGRMHAKVWKITGVNTGGYQTDDLASDAVPLMFWGTVAPPHRDVPIHDQLRAAREILLSLSFDDFEREIRTVLDGMLGPAGFDVREDVLAITVNRWPHGYAYGYLDLWDPKWEEGQAPHEIAHRPFGNIVIANSDAAASAYTQAAIMEAIRAVDELS